jgi:hypothetical protein
MVSRFQSIFLRSVDSGPVVRQDIMAGAFEGGGHSPWVDRKQRGLGQYI